MAIQEEHKRILERICEHTRQRRLVVLAGAGISMSPPASLPGWPKLLELMANHAAQYSESRAAAIREEIATDLLSAADLYATGDRIPKAERSKFLNEVFSTKPSDVTPLAQRIADLDAVGWITTNYDSVLRYALSSRQVEPLGNSDAELQSANSLLGSVPVLVQIHGRASVYDSIVLGEKSYQKLTTREAYRQLLRSLFLNYAVLSVGFSYGDPPFQAVLRYVAGELGGASNFTHAAILPTNASVDWRLLKSANFECIAYDHAAGHGYANDCVAFLARCRAAQAPPVVPAEPPSPNDAQRLVRIFLSLTNRSRGHTFEMVAAAVVVAELQVRPQRREVLATKVARTNGLSRDVSERLVERGLSYLVRTRSASDTDGVFRLADGFKAPERYPGLRSALEGALSSRNRRLARNDRVLQGALDIVRRVMVVQGMTAARAFANQDSPDAYLLEKVVDAAVATSELQAEFKEEVVSSVLQVLQSPVPEVSRELFYLANAAFALESVFLNPLEMDVGGPLSWRLYLDSNVLMRALHRSCDPSNTFATLFERLQALNIPLFMLAPFADEVFHHIGLVQDQVMAAFGSKPCASLVTEYLRDIPHAEQSPILRWYAWGLSASRWCTFSEFRESERLKSKQQFRGHLRRLGVELEGENAIQTLDTSERETLWDDLRRWRQRDQASRGARKLRRAEATQVLWLAGMRQKGTRAWLLSRDGQLRRALKFISGGIYAGYVVTPTAWMMRLNSLHWGEVDVAGFSELMWAVPLTTPVERLKRMVIASVLEHEPDLAGEHPDWLRDQIESEFASIEPLVMADMQADGEDDFDGVAKWSSQLVKPATDEILAALAKRRALEGEGSGSRSDSRPVVRPSDAAAPGSRSTGKRRRGKRKRGKR